MKRKISLSFSDKSTDSGLVDVDAANIHENDKNLSNVESKRSKIIVIIWII